VASERERVLNRVQREGVVEEQAGWRESEEMFSRIFRFSPDAIVISDYESDRLLEFSPNYEKILGLERQQAIGRTTLELGLYPEPGPGRIHAQSHRRRSSGMTFDKTLDPVDDVFTLETATSLYRIVQEALNNVLRHAGGSRVRIQMDRDVNDVIVRIEDHGRGFDPAAADAAAGSGLRSRAERARLAGGTLAVRSAPGEGAVVEIAFPLRLSGGVS
jgi:PAS domain S-box-containing protein